MRRSAISGFLASLAVTVGHERDQQECRRKRKKLEKLTGLLELSDSSYLPSAACEGIRERSMSS